jgi:hypothetical protein
MNPAKKIPERVGLCSTCRHSEQVPGRAAIYYLCALSRTDPRFPKYPKLPVITCSGYEPKSESKEERTGP